MGATPATRADASKRAGARLHDRLAASKQRLSRVMTNHSPKGIFVLAAFAGYE